MSKHIHHIIPVYHCKELGIDPDFDANYVTVDKLDHARIHRGYKCDDLEPLFEYVTPAQWIIDLIPRGDSRDIWASNLLNSDREGPFSDQPTYNEKIIFNRVFKEVSKWPYTSFCYACCPKSARQRQTTDRCVCTMPLWDDNYIRELDYENTVRYVKRLIAEGYEPRRRGERLPLVITF